MENMKKVKFYLSIKLFHQYILSSLAKFQLVKCNLSLAMIWEMTYIHKLPTFSYSLTHWLICNSDFIHTFIDSFMFIQGTH